MQHPIVDLLMKQFGLRQVLLWVAEADKWPRATNVQKTYGDKVKLLIMKLN